MSLFTLKDVSVTVKLSFFFFVRVFNFISPLFFSFTSESTQIHSPPCFFLNPRFKFIFQNTSHFFYIYKYKGSCFCAQLLLPSKVEFEYLTEYKKKGGGI